MIADGVVGPVNTFGYIVEGVAGAQVAVDFHSRFLAAILNVIDTRQRHGGSTGSGFNGNGHICRAGKLGCGLIDDFDDLGVFIATVRNSRIGAAPFYYSPLAQNLVAGIRDGGKDFIFEIVGREPASIIDDNGMSVACRQRVRMGAAEGGASGENSIFRENDFQRAGIRQGDGLPAGS